jgi:pilus assembly protein Flp/PilA
MKQSILKLYVRMQMLKDSFIQDESGQDLIEYALVVALIALGATAAMSGVANSISNAFSNVGVKLNKYTS